MKKVFMIAFMAFTMVFSATAVAQNFSGLDKSPLDIAAYPSSYKEPNKVVRITYGRPQLKGRELSTLAPNGEVWRTGANEAPEITFYTDVNFGGKDIKAGTYALLTIPGKNEWTIILHNAINQWGAYTYDEKTDVARVKAPATSNAKKSLEAFSIAFEKADDKIEMVLGWDKTRVTVPIKVAM